MTVDSRTFRLDLIWLVFLGATGLPLSLVLTTSIFDLTVSLSGILCVGLIAIGRREGYLIGLYNSIVYALLAYGNGLFGEVYLNLFFYLPTGIIGYFMWKQHSEQNKTVVMRRLGWVQRGMVALVCVGCVFLFGWFLGLNPQQNSPFVDATTNVLSIVATFLMMWRYKEQWIIYITLNVVTIVMWILRLQAGSESGGLMILMWSLFLLNAVFGFWRWHMGAKQHEPLTTEGTE